MFASSFRFYTVIEQSKADVLQENVNVYFSEACGSR